MSNLQKELRMGQEARQVLLLCMLLVSSREYFMCPLHDSSGTNGSSHYLHHRAFQSISRHPFFKNLLLSMGLFFQRSRSRGLIDIRNTFSIMICISAKNTYNRPVNNSFPSLLSILVHQGWLNDHSDILKVVKMNYVESTGRVT